MRMRHMRGVKTYTQDDVLKMTGWSRATLHRKRQKGEFPEPFRKDGRNILWRKTEIDMHLKEAELVSNVVWQLIQKKYPLDYETALESTMTNARETAWKELAGEVNEITERLIPEWYANLFDDHLEGWIANSDCYDMGELQCMAEQSAMEEARQLAYENACELLSAYAESRARQIAHDEAVETVIDSIRAKRGEAPGAKVN